MSIEQTPNVIHKVQAERPKTGPAANRERNAEIVRLRKAGVGQREIARTLGLSPSTVSGVLFRAGLTEPTCGRGNGADIVFKRLVVNCLSEQTWREVARRFGVSTKTLSHWRREVLAEAAQ